MGRFAVRGFPSTAAGADRVVVIEDWLAQAVSRKGIPWAGRAKPLDSVPITISRSSKATAGGLSTYRVETSIRPSQETSQAK